MAACLLTVQRHIIQLHNVSLIGPPLLIIGSFKVSVGPPSVRPHHAPRRRLLISAPGKQHGVCTSEFRLDTDCLHRAILVSAGKRRGWHRAIFLSDNCHLLFRVESFIVLTYPNRSPTTSAAGWPRESTNYDCQKNKNPVPLSRPRSLPSMFFGISRWNIGTTIKELRWKGSELHLAQNGDILRNIVFRKMQGISRLAEQLLASQNGLLSSFSTAVCTTSGEYMQQCPVARSGMSLRC